MWIVHLTGSDFKVQDVDRFFIGSQLRIQDVNCLFDWIAHHHPGSDTHGHKLLEKKLSSVRHANTGHLQKNTNANQCFHLSLSLLPDP